MRLLITSILLTICFTAIGQFLSTKKALTFYPGTYIDTEARYTDPTGVNVIIQNSLPKWGTPLLDSGRREQGFSSLIFFNRIINEANDPIEVTIDFPADFFSSPGSPDAYLKIFLPQDSMTLDKEAAYNYGLTSLKSLFDHGSAKPTTFHKIIYPRQECLFYLVILFNQPKDPQGQGFYNTGTRAGFDLEAHSLFYRINQMDFIRIPCGQIVLKKL